MACGEEEPKGGSNEEILADVEANTKIPVEDFTLSTRSVGFSPKFIFVVFCHQCDSPHPHPCPGVVVSRFAGVFSQGLAGVVRCASFGSVSGEWGGVGGGAGGGGELWL